MKLTKSQIKSLRGEVKWIEEYPVAGRWPNVVKTVCASPSAITFMKRCGLVKNERWWIATLTDKGRSLLT